MLRFARDETPPKRTQFLVLRAITQARNTFAFIAACSAWVLGTVLGRQVREIVPSLPVLTWPHLASVSPLYYVMNATSRPNSQRISASVQSPSSGALELGDSPPGAPCNWRFGLRGVASSWAHSQLC